MKKYLPYFAIFLLFFTPVFAQDDYLYDEIIDKQMLIDKILNSKETNEISKTIFSIINTFHFLETFD